MPQCPGSCGHAWILLTWHMTSVVQAVMRDPVIAADGHTYERHAIQDWLQEHSSSPVTGKPLAHAQLIPNTVIDSLIQQQEL